MNDNGEFSAQVMFAEGESRVSLHGFAMVRPDVRASEGAIEHLVYDSLSQLFHVDLIARPGTSANVVIGARPRPGTGPQ